MMETHDQKVNHKNTKPETSMFLNKNPKEGLDKTYTKYWAPNKYNTPSVGQKVTSTFKFDH